MGTQPQNPQPPIVQPGKQLPNADIENPGGVAPSRDDLDDNDKERYEDEFDTEDDYKDEFRDE